MMKSSILIGSLSTANFVIRTAEMDVRSRILNFAEFLYESSGEKNRKPADNVGLNLTWVA